MKVINRGFMAVLPKEPYAEWAKLHDESYVLDHFTEPNIYLIEEDFFEDEPVIKSNFKKVFKNELQVISDDDEVYPDITFENFEQFFSITLGNTVFDLEKGKIEVEKI